MAELRTIDARDRVVGDTIALRSDGPIRERGWKYVRTTRTGRVLIQAVLPGGHVEVVGYADVAPRTGQVAVVAVRVSAMQSAGTLDREDVEVAAPPLAFSPVGPMPTPEPPAPAEPAPPEPPEPEPAPEPAPPVEQPPEPPFDPSGPGWPNVPAPAPEPDPVAEPAPPFDPSGPGWPDSPTPTVPAPASAPEPQPPVIGPSGPEWND